MVDTAILHIKVGHMSKCIRTFPGSIVNDMAGTPHEVDTEINLVNTALDGVHSTNIRVCIVNTK